MPKARAYGADATLKACREASYGVAPLTGYQSLDFKSTDLSSAQPLGDDPLLGRGRNAQDPYRGLITDEGQLDIPLDLRGTGFWLTGLFGDPVTTPTSASGSIVFAVNPTAGDTITLNGTVWTFVSGTAGAEETQIQGTATQTVDQLVSDLNASADAEVSKCSYSRPASTQTLTIEFDTAGPSGNAFTIAASAASVSGSTLTGGGYDHVWESGADDIPSYTIEVGHPRLTTPVFFRHLGTVMESLNFEMGQEGPANARLQLVAQGEERFSATVDANPTAYALRRFSQGRGFIRRGGAALAGVTGGSLTFSNNLERVRVIREAVESCESVDEGRDVEVFPQAFGASSIDIEVAWWTDPTPLGIRRSRGEVVTAVKRALDEAGIEIPFPYRTLTFKEPLALASTDAGSADDA